MPDLRPWLLLLLFASPGCCSRPPAEGPRDHPVPPENAGAPDPVAVAPTDDVDERPDHCGSSIGRQVEWPIIGHPDRDDLPPVTEVQARAALANFRNAWQQRVMPQADEALTILHECMRTDRGYRVSRVSGAYAADLIVRGEPTVYHRGQVQPADLPWVWQVDFVEGSSRLPPSGVPGGFLDEGGNPLLLLHWPEG